MGKLTSPERRCVRGVPRCWLAVVIGVAVAVAVGVAIFPAAGPSRSAAGVQHAFAAYLAAANAGDGVAACALLTPTAQEDMQRLAASRGRRDPSCEARFQGIPDSASGGPPVPIEPIVIDFVNATTAAAHQQGSAARVLLARANARWLISGFSFEPPNGHVQSPASRALSQVALILIVLCSVVMGRRRVRWRWVAAAAMLPIALGAWSDSQEPSTYDLRGLGLLLGIAGAALYVGLVLAGRFLLPRTGSRLNKLS